MVRPIFFPGGDIGTLAVHGTVNDLAVGGATPLYLSAAFILEEGLPIEVLRRVVASMRRACAEVGVALVTGDTKVVDRGKCDQMYVTTAGGGSVPEGRALSIAAARPGDKVIVSGTIGDHGVAVMSVREGLEFETVLESDTAPVTGLAGAVLSACPAVRGIRDPTRGGLSAAVNELAAASRVGVKLTESAIPVRREFALAVEGSIPNEKIKSEGYWAALGPDSRTGQPITTTEWIDRLAPKALAVIAVGTCATYGGFHAMAGNPTGAMGLADYLGWKWKSKAGLPIVNVPRCPVQPDNFMETLLYLLYQVAGLAPMIPLDDQLRPTWLFGATEFKVPKEAIGRGFHEAVRGVLSHHVVIRDGKIANYHPYPPTPWNANPRDVYGTPGPYEDAVQNTPTFEENGPDNFKGIDIMRAVRSLDPCLPCGVHMYLGDGKEIQVKHSPMHGAQVT